MSIITKSLIVVASVATIGIAAAGIYAYNELHSNPTPISTETSSPSVTPSPSFNSSPSPSPSPSIISGLGTLQTQENDQADEALQAAIKDGVEVYEEGVISFMHHLTHQKVEADDKWVSIEMTPDRVKLLVEVIEKKGHMWKNQDKLLAIAKKWNAGDFSEADKDHNYLWKLEGGNIGEATGILSPEGEADFIQKSFR